MSDRRNVVLVTVDSLRADHCGFMGYDRDTTPALDRMAAEGLSFENAVASGVPTVASMTAVMTGEHSFASPEIGFHRRQRREVTGRPTVAEVLSEAGYATGGLVANPPASSHFGFDEGFDWFEDFLAADRGVAERAWNRVFRRSIRGGRAATYLRLLRNVVRREEVLRPWADYYDRILEWRRSVEGPYFLWVLLLDTHHPWLPPSGEQRWSSRAEKYRSFRLYWEMLRSGFEPDFPPERRRQLVDLYDDSIRYGDRFLSRLRADLAEDDPVFVVHADHGEEFGEHGRYGHQPRLTEELVHVPLVVWNADRTGTVARPVGLRSLAPALAGLAGVDHPFPASDPLRESAGQPWATSKVLLESGRRTAIRTREHKYRVENGRGKLYALRNGEARSVEDGTGRSDAGSRRRERAVESVDGAGVGRAADAFHGLHERHVSAEGERRAIRAAASDLAGGDSA